MNKPIKTSWTMDEEFNLINSLGSFHEGKPQLSLKEHLLGYIEGAKKRTKWGKLDKAKVIQYAIDRLAAV
jgi:hypothetical protein